MTHKAEIEALRKEYSLSELLEIDVDLDPIRQFHKWFNQAVHAEVREPNAMCLSTISNDGFPDARIVLLKGIEHHGFVFYTNYESDKGEQIKNNPHVHLNFVWLELERQVRITGEASKISDEESEEYFNSRPFESKLGAIVSSQSKILESREKLLDDMSKASELYKTHFLKDLNIGVVISLNL